jgi:cobalt-zinc-cadmium efflux system outer membrane protein
VEVARGERAQAALRPNPDVSFEQREQADGMDRQTAIEVMLPLDLFRREPRIARANLGVDHSVALLRDRERLLAAAVRERYASVLASMRRLEVTEGVVAAARQTLDVLSNRVREGAAPPLERDLALVELRRLEGERALEAGRLAADRSRLNVLLGREPAAPIELADTLEQLAGVTTASGSIDGDRADVQLALTGLAAARAETSLARQTAKPQVTVFGGYMRMEAGFPQSGLSPAGTLVPIQMAGHNVAIGVRVSLPVFDRAQGTVAAARAREISAARAVDERRLAASGEVAAATARAAAAREALAAYGDDTRALARRNVDVMRETYTLGRATLVDVLAEQRRYLDFESGYIAALAEAATAAADLQRATGELQ